MEFYIAGGSNLANKHFDLVDADSKEVYFSATGDGTNNFLYDFWNMKEIQGKSVYIQIVDSDDNEYGLGWAHLELDQIRQVKFAPTAADVRAAEKQAASTTKVFDQELPGLNAETYEGSFATLDDLANFISVNEPTEKYYVDCFNNFEVEQSFGVDVFSTLDVASSGLYTFAIDNSDPYRLILNGETIFESDGSDSVEFIPLALSNVGQYELELLYLSNSGDGVSLYLAQGAFDAWNDAFALLSGTGAGYVHSFANYYVEKTEGVPEPSTWALLILGTAGLLYWRKRK